jgi:ADP-dependent NAD(P)H-hydrate dehydratase
MTADPVVVTVATLRDWRLPAPGEDKEQRGRVLVAGGTASTPGAVRLAGEAALRAGAGKLRMATVGSAAASLAVAVPEAAVLALDEDEEGRPPAECGELLGDLAAEADAVLVGPGLKGSESVVSLVETLLGRLGRDGPGLVLDALASAYVTAHPDGVPDGTVLTVNPGELEAIGLGSPADTAARTGAVVLCGGPEKHVAHPDGRCWVLRGGGPGLGCSGSGDVQAGLVAGLLARGAEPAQAAVWGGFVHLRAGEELAAAVGQLGFLARELPPVVPRVLEQLR